MTYCYNKSQQDAQFFNFILVKTTDLFTKIKFRNCASFWLFFFSGMRINSNLCVIFYVGIYINVSFLVIF